MPAIDTDAAVALVSTRHPHHAKARMHFQEAPQVYLHPSVISEFTTVIRRQANRAGGDGNRAARQALEALLAQPRVHIETAIDHGRAADLYLRANPLSFTDAVVATFCHHLDKAQPITFDQDLLKAARRTKRP